VRKKLPLAKGPVSKFRSQKPAAEYLETHSVAEVWNQLPEEKQAKPSAALKKLIRERHANAKSPISIRFVPEQIGRQENRRDEVVVLDAITNVHR
jgi:hypothetical protein